MLQQFHSTLLGIFITQTVNFLCSKTGEQICPICFSELLDFACLSNVKGCYLLFKNHFEYIADT